MYINLKATEEEDIIIVETEELNDDEYISLQDILEGSMAAIYPRYSGNAHSLDKISEYQRKLNSYSFSKIELMDASLEIATEVFTRINTTGKSLNVFEIMCAKTYDEEKDFTIIICLIVMGLSINANTNQNFKTKNNAFFLLCRNMFTM